MSASVAAGFGELAPHGIKIIAARTIPELGRTITPMTWLDSGLAVEADTGGAKLGDLPACQVGEPSEQGPSRGVGVKGRAGGLRSATGAVSYGRKTEGVCVSRLGELPGGPGTRKSWMTWNRSSV